MFWKLNVDSSTNKILWYVCCFECFAELSSIIQILPNCAFCEVEPFGRSMEKFCISSTDRKLAESRHWLYSGRSAAGGQMGGYLCHWTQLLAQFFFRHFGFFSFPNILTSVMWYLYCWEPREVRGAKPGMKKWSLLSLLLRYFIDILLLNGNISFLHPHWWKVAVEITSQISGLVSPGEGNHVDGELSQVRVQLPGEPQASGNTGHCERDEMVEIAISGCGQL